MAFTRQDTITITGNSALLPSTQTDFPLLYSVTHDDLKTTGNGGYMENANGYDWRPFSDSGLTSALSFELEFYDGSAGTIAAWVKIPSLALSGVFYVGFGDAALNTDASSTSTWNSSYIMVQHFPNGTTLTAVDSTANNLDGTLVNTPTATSGQIDGAANFVSASSQYINIGDTSLVDFGTGDYTFQAWIRPTAVSASSHILSKDSDTQGRQFEFSIGAAGAGTVRAVIFDTPTEYALYNSGNILSADTWALLHLVRNGNSAGAFDLYKNGASQTFTFSSTADFPKTMQAVAAPMTIGSRAYSGFEDYFPGKIDEIRILSTALSANWITAEYSNQNDPGTFLSHSFQAVDGGPAGDRIGSMFTLFQ